MRGGSTSPGSWDGAQRTGQVNSEEVAPLIIGIKAKQKKKMARRARAEIFIPRSSSKDGKQFKGQGTAVNRLFGAWYQRYHFVARGTSRESRNSQIVSWGEMDGVLFCASYSADRVCGYLGRCAIFTWAVHVCLGSYFWRLQIGLRTGLDMFGGSGPCAT